MTNKKIPGTVYQVGGSVRDKIMGKPVSDIDYVVVGATPEEMLDFGFKKAGKDFPVFLHPVTKDEYALARTERKTGNGYHGFSTIFDNNITLEDDLKRRDLTINAIAMDSEGNLIDPYNGQKDIKDKKLRHVSVAFSEDPLRILRVARFAARFGFSVHEDTMALMKEIHKSGETTYLNTERIWKETDRAIMHNQFSLYFKTLNEVGLFQQIFTYPFSNKTMEQFTTFEENFAQHATTLESRMSRLILPANLNEAIDTHKVIDFCKTNKISNKTTKHIIISCNFWNVLHNSEESIRFSGNDKWYSLLTGQKTFENHELNPVLLAAYNDVYQHTKFLKGEEFIPDVITLSQWANALKINEGEIAKQFSGTDKMEIRKTIDEKRKSVWNDFHNNSKTKKLKM